MRQVSSEDGLYQEGTESGPVNSIESIYCNISIPPSSKPLFPPGCVSFIPPIGIFQVDSVLVQSHIVPPFDWLRRVSV